MLKLKNKLEKDENLLMDKWYVWINSQRVVITWWKIWNENGLDYDLWYGVYYY